MYFYKAVLYCLWLGKLAIFTVNWKLKFGYWLSKLNYLLETASFFFVLIIMIFFSPMSLWACLHWAWLLSVVA